MHTCIKDENGCYIALDIEIGKNRISLINIYGPSSGDDPAFIDKIEKILLEFNNSKTIIAGDWNCTLDFELDNKNYSSSLYKSKTRNKIKQIMNQYDLIDIWRNNNPALSSFTWRKFNTTKQARLDYFLISDNLSGQINNSQIDIKYKSDHSLVTLSVKQNSFTHDRTYWKFNKSLLKNQEFIKQIKEVISQTKKEYCALVYNTDNIDLIPNEQLCFRISDQIFFEVLLMNIRSKCISFSTFLKRKETEQIQNLEKKLKILEENVTDQSLDELDTVKNELEEIRNKRMEGITIRSRTVWIKEGEKSSKYFCNLENRNYTDKAMPAIESENGDLLTNQTDIINEVKTFYKNLYEEKQTINENLNNLLPENTPKLTENQMRSISGEITLDELGTAIKQMKNDKSPGSDGYSAEFYKFFYRDIGIFLLRSINEGFEKGELTSSQKQGVIICIPKENKEKKLLKNWRPISLLNYSYKIASAAIANRLKTVLPSILNTCQKGFIKGRYIGENIRLIYDLLFYTELNDIPGLLLSIDYQKAFDSISWSFLESALVFFNFGNDIVKWFRTLYKDAKSNLHVNGQYSSWFEIKRGVRQGDPCSPYFYLIGAEILSIMLRNNPDIKGITVREKEYLLSQFADDTMLCLDGNEKSFRATIETLDKFSEISGLLINNEKTQILWIGSRMNSKLKFMRDRNYTWDPGIIRILGINFSTNLDTIFEINYRNKLKEIERLLTKWEKRNLTPFGKITVIKTLAVPKLLYLFLNLPDPPECFMKKLDDIIYKFLWDSKPSKINRHTIQLEKEEGGLDMINLKNFISGLKLSWLRRLITDTDFKARVLNFYPMLKNLYKMGGEVTKVLVQHSFNPFWEEVIKKYEYLCNNTIPENCSEFVSEFIFFNRNIVIGGKIVYIKDWIDKNIVQIGELLNNNNQFMTYQEFINRYNINTDFITYQGIIQSIKSYMRKLNLNIEREEYTVQQPKVWKIILTGNTMIKTQLLQKGPKHTAITKWNFKYGILNWEEIFKQIHQSTQETKLKWFAYKIIYRIIPTNRHLFLLKIKGNPMCDFCKENEQTIIHLFWQCEHVSRFWARLETLIKETCRDHENFNLSEELVLFGIKEHVEIGLILYLVILYAKYYIFICKIEERIPRVEYFRIFMKAKMMTEMKSQPEHRKNLFNELLVPYQNLLL